MKAEELKSKTPDQLRDSLVQLKKEAFNLRFQKATNHLENTAHLRCSCSFSTQTRSSTHGKAM